MTDFQSAMMLIRKPLPLVGFAVWGDSHHLQNCGNSLVDVAEYVAVHQVNHAVAV